MKLIIRSFFFHVLCIIVFGIIYYLMNEMFLYSREDTTPTVYDYMLLSTALQTGVGFVELYPSNTISKLLIILQLLMMLATHIITLYYFVI
jgi:hypothetical protein